MNIINVVLTIDDSYSPYLATCMASILVNCDDKYKLNFYVIDSGIVEENKRKIAMLKSIKDFNIAYSKIDKELFKNIPSCKAKHISDETHYRFLISSLYKEIDKVICIDADLVFTSDISKLWEINIEEYYIGAVIDQQPFGGHCSWIPKLNLPTSYEYINSGLMLCNLKKWRQDKIEEKLFENAMFYGEVMHHPDQDTLNVTLCSKVKVLDPRYNVFVVLNYFREEDKEKAFSSPFVIHWAGRSKAWINPCFPYADIWWQYARQTPFYEEILFKNILLQQSQNFEKYLQQVHNLDKDLNVQNKSKLSIFFGYYYNKWLSKVPLGKTKRIRHLTKKYEYKKLLKKQ